MLPCFFLLNFFCGTLGFGYLRVVRRDYRSVLHCELLCLFGFFVSSFWLAMKRVFVDEHDEERGFSALERESKRSLITRRNVMTELTIPELAEEICRRIGPQICEQIVPHFKDLIPEMIKDALEGYIPRGLCLNRTVAPQSTMWKLHFSIQLPPTIFTFSDIVSKDGLPVKVRLIDCNSNPIEASGPCSSFKAEIVVLKGNFGEDGVEDWNQEEFDANVISERKGKQPLLIGDLILPIIDGVGHFGKLRFTDNSRWNKSGKFRIGVKNIQSLHPGIRIREARSEAFAVKDQRGEGYKKLHPPSLDDEVWRLEKIRKGGPYHKKLEDNGIRTVEDFLKRLVMNSSGLRNNILGGLRGRMWDTITQHARECSVNGKLFEFNCDGVELLLNSVYEVIGATFFGEGYIEEQNFTSDQKNRVETLKTIAYKNQKDIIPLTGKSSQMYPSSLLASNFTNEPESRIYPQNKELGEHTNIQHVISDGYHDPPKGPFNPETLPISPILFPLTYIPQTSDRIISAAEYENNWDEDLPSSSGNWWPEYFPSSTSFSEIIPCRRTKWFKVRTVMKLGISVMKDLAARRMATLVEIDH